MVDNVLALQEIDLRIRQLQQEITDIPARKKREEDRLATHKQAVELADKNLKLKMAEIKKQELDVDACNQNIAKLRTQQMSLKTNKEFKAIEDEVTAIRRKISGLEEQELVIMEDVENKRKSLQTAQAELQKEADLVKNDMQVYEDRLTAVQKQIADEVAIRELAAKSVEAGWLSVYNRIFKAKDKALVPVEPMEEGRSGCGGCHFQLSPATVHDAKRHINMVSCDYCGRLLY